MYACMDYEIHALVLKMNTLDFDKILNIFLFCQFWKKKTAQTLVAHSMVTEK